MASLPETFHFTLFKPRNPGFILLLAALVAMVIAGWTAAHTMDTQGHYVSGMNNQVVWGLPHVFAIFLILAASGVLNIASLGSVFAIENYRPWGRLSALMAICLLLGGLVVLVLDLGRPERLVVAMTHYNFKSIFAWNIFLYTGFIVVVIAYLVTMFERRLNAISHRVGVFAFVWRLVLTSGTGSIFGFLVARQFFDAAMMVPVFIVLSLVLGTALFILMQLTMQSSSVTLQDRSLLPRLCRLLGLFIAAELLLVGVFHLTNLYATEHHGVERFILLNGGGYTLLFWAGQILLGCLVPLVLVFLTDVTRTLKGIVTVALLAVAGGLSLLYVTIIGGQAYPQVLFPGKIVRSIFYDGVVASYQPSFHELFLGLGGVALSLLLVLLALRALPFLPSADRLVSRQSLEVTSS